MTKPEGPDEEDRGKLPQFLHSTTGCVYGKGGGDAAQMEG